MITESPKKSVDEVHGRPSHPSGMGPAFPGFHACRLSPARPPLGHLRIDMAATANWPGMKEKLLLLEAARCRGPPRIHLHRGQRKRAARRRCLPCETAWPAIRQQRTCRAQRGRRCERGAVGRGGFSLIGAPFELRKKICPRKSALAGTMGEAFVASAEAFMENGGAKVTQMAGVTLEPLKPKPITITDPTRCPGSPQARPGAAHRVRNTHTEQAIHGEVSW